MTQRGENPVGASLLAIAVDQFAAMLMCSRHREQARSHKK